ncbi:hypothetical protein SAMN05444405_1253 [Bacteroides luti]|uniref:Uncharacterized protein n=1 Tax=Bacteroides luti TaxID=1297750 RepID=A0A1M5H903_9BACE|nr:hypothetical protein SAMN05444405_1253 [Bacteroides luti]
MFVPAKKMEGCYKNRFTNTDYSVESFVFVSKNN